MRGYQIRVLHGDCWECSILVTHLDKNAARTRYQEMNDEFGQYHMAARFPIIPVVDMPCFPKPLSFEFVDQMLTSRRAQRNLVDITSTDIVDVVYI